MINIKLKNCIEKYDDDEKTYTFEPSKQNYKIKIERGSKFNEIEHYIGFDLETKNKMIVKIDGVKLNTVEFENDSSFKFKKKISLSGISNIFEKIYIKNLKKISSDCVQNHEYTKNNNLKYDLENTFNSILNFLIDLPNIEYGGLSDEENIKKYIENCGKEFKYVYNSINEFKNKNIFFRMLYFYTNGITHININDLVVQYVKIKKYNLSDNTEYKTNLENNFELFLTIPTFLAFFLAG